MKRAAIIFIRFYQKAISPLSRRLADFIQHAPTMGLKRFKGSGLSKAVVCSSNDY